MIYLFESFLLLIFSIIDMYFLPHNHIFTFNWFTKEPNIIFSFDFKKMKFIYVTIYKKIMFLYLFLLLTMCIRQFFNWLSEIRRLINYLCWQSIVLISPSFQDIPLLLTRIFTIITRNTSERCVGCNHGIKASYNLIA